jgi:hypothetical protein
MKRGMPSRCRMSSQPRSISGPFVVWLMAILAGSVQLRSPQGPRNNSEKSNLYLGADFSSS